MFLAKIGAEEVWLQQPGQPGPRECGFLAGRIPTISAQRHPIDATSLDCGDRLPSRITIEVCRHRRIKIAEENDLGNLLERDGATDAGRGRCIGPSRPLNVEIIVRPGAAHAQSVGVATNIQDTRPLLLVQTFRDGRDFRETLFETLDKPTGPLAAATTVPSCRIASVPSRAQSCEFEPARCKRGLPLGDARAAANLPLKGGGRLLRYAKQSGGDQKLRRSSLSHALSRDPHPNPPPFRGRAHTEFAACTDANSTGNRFSGGTAHGADG